MVKQKSSRKKKLKGIYPHRVDDGSLRYTAQVRRGEQGHRHSHHGMALENLALWNGDLTAPLGPAQDDGHNKWPIAPHY